MERWLAEENTQYKQPIGYWLIVNEDNKLFVYTRGWANSNAGDSRIHNKISVGVGGHIEREEEFSKNPIKDTLVRELEEEINLTSDSIDSIDIIGYINEDDGGISEVHIGACYVVFVKNFSFELMDGEIASGEFIPLWEYEKMIASWSYDIENWSKMLIEPLKQYLAHKK
jgi:predicted NUDIX family phosphoesterase